MTLKKEPFVNYKLPEDKAKEKTRTISVKLNKEENVWINKMKSVMQQEKEGTLIKQLARIGSKVILDTPQGKYFQTLQDNIRKNKRLGIEEIE